MPANPSNATIWFYQQFYVRQEGAQFCAHTADDWSRLQVWNGEALEPAFPNGIQGLPTKEQQEFLYNKMQQGELFHFQLGEAMPSQINEGKRTLFNPKPQMPKMPKDPGEKAGIESRNAYQNKMRLYNREVQRYQENRDILQKFGPGLKTSVDRYNAGRDIAWEKAELAGRNNNHSLHNYGQYRARADQVISKLMAPKPVALPDIFFSTKFAGEDFVMRYDIYDEEFEPNAYDLPAGSELSEYDAATINFAMLGAKSDMQAYFRDEKKYGPVRSEIEATNGFNMLLTGLFGVRRMNLEMEHCMGQALRMGKESIDAYVIEKDPSVLGRRLGDCVQNIKNVCTGISQKNLTQDMVAGTKLTERLLDLFNRKPDIYAASGLNDRDLEFMRGYVQLGHIYDRYAAGRMKQNDAIAHGKKLTTQEKAEIMADAVIRRMVEKELANDIAVAQATDEFKREDAEAAQKDEATMLELAQWVANNPTGDREQYIKQNDVNTHHIKVMSQPLEHEIIYKLAQPGVLESWRQRLMKDPAILAQASKEPLGLTGEALSRGNELDGMVDRLVNYTATTDAQKQAWFNNMKAAVAGGDERNAASPWLNAAVESDAGRLMIAVPNNEGGKNMVSVASLVRGGLRALQNPDPTIVDMMYRNAMEGNLYYYQVGKNMPQRVSAEGEQAAAEQLMERPKPSLWQRFWHAVTGGRAYPDIYKPLPDSDPAAMESIYQGRAGRAEAITDEVAAHQRIRNELAEQNALAEQNEQEMNNTQVVESAEERHLREVDTFCRAPGNDVRRDFPHYEPNDVYERLSEQLAADTGEGDALNREKSAVKAIVAQALYTVDADPEMIRQAMAAAVLLEAMKQEHMAGNGTPLREQFNQDRNATVNGIANNEVFKAFTEGANNDMLMHFIMVGGAGNMYQAIQTSASMHANNQVENQQDVPVNEVQMNHEQVMGGA